MTTTIETIQAGIESSTRNTEGVPLALVDAARARASELTALLRDSTEYADAAAYLEERDALEELAEVWRRLPRLAPSQ